MTLKHGSLENLVLNIVWDNAQLDDGTLSVCQVQDCLNRLNTNKKWAYTTVKTILDRLTDKGILQKIKTGKKYNYASILPREQMAYGALKRISLEYFKDNFDDLADFVNEIQKSKDLDLIYAKR